MSYLKLENNAKTTLASAITAGATSLTVTSASLFPTEGDFLITIWNSSAYSDPGDDSNMEIFLVTAVSGNTFTVTRAQESTAAKAHSSGHSVQMLITAGILEEIQDAIKDNFTELDDTPSSYSGQGLKGVRVKGAEDGVEFYTTTDSDEKVKVSSNDTTSGYLNGKLVAGAGINLTEIGDGGDETLSIINDDKGSDAISAHEITYDHSNLHSHANKIELDKITDGDHDVRTDNPHTVTKTQVGLSNVPNLDTTDAVNNEHIQNTDTILQVDLGYYLDQSQTDHHGDPSSTKIKGNELTAQTFTAGVNANIYSVKLWVYADLPNADLVLELQSTVGGEPSGVVLATESLPTSAFGYQEYTEEEFIFSPTYALVSGTQYALVCRSATTRSYYLATDDDQKLYANGSQWQSTDGGSNWTEQIQSYDGDTAFKVYVVGVGVSDLINNGTLKQNLEVDTGKTIDGRDISVDGTKLDTIETNADVTDVANVTAALASITVNAHSDITSAGADIEDAVIKKHTQGTDTTLGAMSADINMNTHKLTSLSVPGSAGDSIRQTSKITEVNLETAYDHSQIITGNPHAIDLTDLSTYDHKALQNLQGGQANEYYHLKAAEHTELTAWLDDVTLGSDGATTLPSLNVGDDTNFTKIEVDGTLEFNGTATVFKDINMGAATLSRPAASQPDEANFLDEGGGDTGITTLAYAIGEKASGSVEIQHDYKEGSDIVFHVHWQGIAAPTGTDNVQWRLTYALMRPNTTLDAATIIDTVDTAIDTQYKSYRSDFVAIDGATKGNNGGSILIEDQLIFTLERVVATGDAYTGDALVATVGIHYEIDTIGSRQITTK